MPGIRVVLPAAVGLVLLVIGVRSATVELESGGASVVSTVQRALLPVAIGAGLILVSLAVSRRSRAGYVLGIATAILGIAAGIAAIVVEIPYLQEGGMGGALGGGVVVIAVLWIGLWAAYGVSMWRARSSFAATWARGDRTFAIVLSGLVVFTVAAYISLGAVATEATDTADAAVAQANALVAGTSLTVQVIDLSVDTSAVAGSTPAVERLVLELHVQSPEAYPLYAAPALCLVDLATAQDPGYRPDAFCWGGPGRAVALEGAFPDLGIRSGTQTIRVDLTRGSSVCAFGPGPWNAALRILPSIAATAGNDPYLYLSVSAQVQVEAQGAPPASTNPGATSDCIASMVSP